jgi:hypothetical protein
MLWLLLGLALLIRLWGIGYGLPFVYWTDEYHEVMRALELGAGNFNLSRTGKGGFYFLLYFEYGLYYVALRLAGVISTAQEFAEQFVRDPTMFYIMGRATAALFGCATVAAAYYLARRAYLTRAGVLAALFLTFNVVHVDLSHRVGVDVPMTFFATLALYFGLQVASYGRSRDYLVAGLCAALATTTKLPGILLLLPLLIAHTYYVVGSTGGPSRWFASRGLWQAVAVFIVVLAISNPGILLHFDYLSLFSAPAQEMLEEDAFDAAAGFDSVGRPNLYLYYLNVLQASMGWPLFGLAIVSVGYAVWKRTPPDVILLSYAAINYLAISSTSSEVLYFPRYALPIMVVLAVLAGRALSDLIQIVARWRMAVLATLTFVLVVGPLTQSVRYANSLTQTDTRTVAKEWFDAHVPAGSKVLIEGTKIAASRRTVPLADSRESLERRIAYWKIKEPRQAKFVEVRRAVHEGGGYDLELVKITSIASLDYYAGRGVEYFVVRPDYFMGSRKAEGSSARFLGALRSDARVKLLRRFEANSSSRPGPAIEIYRIQPSAAPNG